MILEPIIKFPIKQAIKICILLPTLNTNLQSNGLSTGQDIFCFLIFPLQLISREPVLPIQTSVSLSKQDKLSSKYFSSQGSLYVVVDIFYSIILAL